MQYNQCSPTRADRFAGRKTEIRATSWFLGSKTARIDKVGVINRLVAVLRGCCWHPFVLNGPSTSTRLRTCWPKPSMTNTPGALGKLRND